MSAVYDRKAKHFLLAVTQIKWCDFLPSNELCKSAVFLFLTPTSVSLASAKAFCDKYTLKLALMTKGKKDDADDVFSQKLDMCLTDGIVKTGGGALLGALSSVLFLKRRRWPIIAGIGMGIGLAYANCEFELNPKKKEGA